MKSDMSVKEIEYRNRLRRVREIISGFEKVLSILYDVERDLQVLIRREKNNRMLDELLANERGE